MQLPDRPPRLPITHAIVVVPTYNERDNLDALVGGVLAHTGTEVLVVDDQSPDGTGAVAEDLARAWPGRMAVVHRRGPRGLGLSLREGLARAAQGSADLVIQMDADLSHDPAYLPQLAAAAATADLVIGSRYLGGVHVVNWPLHRIALSTFANWYVRAVTGMAVRDCTSGFRCWRRSALAGLPLDRVQSDGYAFQVEMLALARLAGCRIVESPIVFVERRHGKSKLSSRVILESAVTPWRLRARVRRLPSA